MLNEKEKYRYRNQIILKDLGETGQKKLKESFVVVIGCGGLGNMISNQIVRAGIGKIIVVDRDIVETDNLHRQSLFEEKDVGKYKSEVIYEKLIRINSDVNIAFKNENVNSTNIEKIIEDSDLVIDGTDNMETRFLINDACVKHKIPWIYGGAVGVGGMTMNIIPEKTPCFRCIFQSIPEHCDLPTRSVIGILNTIPTIIGSIQTTEAYKILLGKRANKNLIIYDVWEHEFLRIKIKRNKDCECCVKHNFEFLNKPKSINVSSAF